MLGLIEKAEEIGWGMIVLVIAIAILFVPVAVESWNKFLDALGLVKKKNLFRKQREKEIAAVYEHIEELQSGVVSKQEEYHQQSITIRDNLARRQDDLYEKQIELKQDVKNITQMLEEYIQKDNKRTIASLRTTLWRLHKEFVSQGYVTPDGLKTFSELGKVYEAAGGNDVYHEKLQPEVLALDITYPDGSIYKIKEV